jgi:hypothetical protein
VPLEQTNLNSFTNNQFPVNLRRRTKMRTAFYIKGNVEILCVSVIINDDADKVVYTRKNLQVEISPIPKIEARGKNIYE